MLVLTVIKLYLIYWIVFINLMLSFIFINIWNCLNLYITMLINNKLSPLSWFMVTIVILISPCVIHNSIDYLSIMDSSCFIFYIILFQLSMINFVLCHDIIHSFLYWDLLGLFSYSLINFWSSKVNCGIKAVLYNKIGDNFFLFLIVLFYSLLSFIAFSLSLPISILISFLLYYYSIIISTMYSSSLYLLFIFIYFPFCILFILFSKSAQLPFSTWSLNAMSAPTPIPAPLHSSTMVIAGVFGYYYWWYDNYNNRLFFIIYFNFFYLPLCYFIMIVI
jgi:NADH:ubiquinone oxidoreductase subunit 5 (subunit L)/multisubunit Na+/H+ antiporter MnhA subunit